MKHRPRKRFGQNFLQNQGVIQSIIQAFHPSAGDNVLEIGPGLGALTQHLLPMLDALTVIEIDRDLQAALVDLFAETGKLRLIPQDALTVAYDQFGPHLRVIGNLPYNISTPLILHLLHYSDWIEDLHFMLQKEVVQRLAAAPSCKDYGRLSVMVQYFCEVQYLFDVDPSAFYPKPKVDSAIVRLVPHRESPFVKTSFSKLERLLAQAFAMRRKTIANNLKPWLSADELQALGVAPSLRPEQIEIDQYVKIANYVFN